jgi:hypothetical protein
MAKGGPTIEPVPLKLLAKDAEDLTVMSACLQDALAPVGDIAWLKDEQRLLIAFNRFMWEQGGEDSGGDLVYYRIHSVLSLDGVGRVRSRGYDLKDRDRMLSFMSLRPVDGGLDLVFAEDAQIRVEAESVAAALADQGDPWPTRWKPGHDLGSIDADTSE